MEKQNFHHRLKKNLKVHLIRNLLLSLNMTEQESYQSYEQKLFSLKIAKKTLIKWKFYLNFTDQSQWPDSKSKQLENWKKLSKALTRRLKLNVKLEMISKLWFSAPKNGSLMKRTNSTLMEKKRNLQFIKHLKQLKIG